MCGVYLLGIDFVGEGGFPGFSCWVVGCWGGCEGLKEGGEGGGGVGGEDGGHGWCLVLDSLAFFVQPSMLFDAVWLESLREVRGVCLQLTDSILEASL